MLRFIVNVTTAGLVLFNTYNQFKAKKDDKALKKIYSIYFKVLCIFLVFDNLLSFFLRIIPFYMFFKLLFIIWLSVPKCSGSIFIYRFYVNGLMRTYEEDVDQLIERIKIMVQENIKRYKEFAYGKLKQKKENIKTQENENSTDVDINDVIHGEIECAVSDISGYNNNQSKKN